MHIRLNDIGRRYNNEWIFKGINLELSDEHNYVISGGNGSGKSTLLQLIAGNLTPSQGNVYRFNNKEELIATENWYRYISVATPYLDLYEEYTLKETVLFQEKLKPFLSGWSANQLIELCELKKSENKQLRYFSSGMRQRVKLMLAIMSDTPVILLDEPASNLDKSAINWYRQLIHRYGNKRLIIVCSNQQQEEYDFCDKEILIDHYK